MYPHPRRAQVRAFVPYGHHNTRFVTLLQWIKLMQVTHRISLNALTHFTTRNGSHLNGSRPEHRQDEASYASYAWLLILQLHVHLNLHDFGWLLPLSCIISCLIAHVRNFESHMQLEDRCAPVKIYSSAESSALLALQFQEVSVRSILPGGTSINYYWPN
jgi:hypothetical protein